MNALRQLTQSYGHRHRWRIAAMVFLEIVANVLTIVLALATAQAFAQLFAHGSLRGEWLVSWGFPSQSEAVLACLGGLIALKMGLDLLKRWGRGLVGEYYLMDLRNALFSHHLDLTADQYTHKDGGRFLLRFSGDLSGIQNMISRGMLGFLGDLSLVLLGLAVIFYLDERIGGLLLCWLLLFGAWLAWLNRGIGQIEEQRRNQKSGLLAFVARQLRFIFTIKAFNQRTPVLDQYHHRTQKIQKLGLQYHRWAAMLEASSQAGGYLSIWMVFVVAYYTQSLGQSTPDHLITIGLILLSWRTPLSRLLQIGLVWKKGLLSWRKLKYLFEQPTENWCDDPNAPSIPSKGNWRLHELQLTDSGGKPLLFLDFEAQPGQKLACIIPTGGGKTMLTQALAGLYPITSGAMTIGGVNLNEVDKKSWRRQFSYVSAAFPLRGRTVYEAITFSKNSRYQADTQAQWRYWQSSFPPLASIELDTPLKGEGSRLSAVQYQLLLWLRTFLANKPIWILDDAFVALPAGLQVQLCQMLNKKSKNKILFFLLSDDNQMINNELKLSFVSCTTANEKNEVELGNI